jgi:hypothetical protein
MLSFSSGCKQTCMRLGHGHADAIILYIWNLELVKKELYEDSKRQGEQKSELYCPDSQFSPDLFKIPILKLYSG